MTELEQDLSSDHLSEEELASVAFAEATLDAARKQHLDACARCLEEVREVTAGVARTGAMLDTWAPPVLSEEAKRRVFVGLESSVGNARGRGVMVLLALIAAALGLLLARGLHAPGDLPEAGLAMLGAAAVALSLGTRFARAATGAALLLAVALPFMVGGGVGQLHPAMGLKCLVVEIGVGLCAAWGTAKLAPGLFRAGLGDTHGRANLPAALSAGALGAEGAILLTCHAPHGLLHGLVFHALGVGLATALAVPLGRVLAASGAER